MKRLHIFILKSFLGPLFVTFCISLFVLLMQFMFRYIEDFVGKGLEASIILEFVLYAAATLVPMALPLSVLLASIMTLGDLGENYELTALKASGISLQRIMSPLVIFVIMISVGAFFYSNTVIPLANIKLLTLYKDIEKTRPEIQIKAGAFNDAIEGYSIRISHKNPETGVLYNLKIYDHKVKKDNVKITVADSGKMVFKPELNSILVILYNGYSYEDVLKNKRFQNNRPFRKDEFEIQKFFLKLDNKADPTDAALYKDRYKMLDVKRLQRSIDSIGDMYVVARKRQYSVLFNDNIFKKEKSINIFKRKNILKLDKSPAFVPDEVLNKRDYKNDLSNKKSDSLNSKKIEIEEEVEEEIVKESYAKHEEIDSLMTAFADKGEGNVYRLFSDMTADSKAGIMSKAITEAKNSSALVERQDQQIAYKRNSIIRRKIEWHRKFILSFACFVFFIIGAPLGAIIRKGGLGLPVVISIVFFIIYYIITNMGEKIAREGVISPFEGMWISSIVLFPIGVFLTYKSTTDSAMLNMDAYKYFFMKLFAKFKKKEVK